MKKLQSILIAVLLSCITLNIAAQQTPYFDNNPITFKGHKTTVNDLEFTDDGSLLYSCGGKNQIIVFNAETGEVVRSTDQQGFAFPINKISLNYNDSLLAYGGFFKDVVTICNPITFEIIREIQDFQMIDELCFSPSSNLLAVVGMSKESGNQTVIIYNAETGEKKQILFEQQNKDLPISVCFSNDEKYVASGVCNNNKGVRIWDVQTGELVRTITLLKDIYPVQFSPDGKYIAGGGGDNNIYIWKVSTGELVHTLTGSNDIVLTIDYSPDGKTIAGAGFDYNCSFKTWDTQSGKLIQSVGGKVSQVQKIIFHPSGNKIAVSYTTYGDALEVPTINMFSPDKSMLETKWFEVNSEKSGLNIEFPETVIEIFSEDKNYEYYDYELKQSGSVFQIRATKYLCSIKDNKRNSAIKKDVKKFAEDKTNITGKNFTIDNYPAYEGIGFIDDTRYHYLVAFVKDVKYSIKYSDTKTEENINEKRFFNSFKVK